MIENVLSHWVDFEPLNEKSVILNCGAGSGDFAKILGERTLAIIRCYEPFPEENGLTPAAALMVHRCAVGRLTDFAPIAFCPNHMQSSSLHRRSVPINKTGMTIRLIPVRSLDDILAEVERVDYLNLDIEGEEWDIMDSHPIALEKILQLSVQFHTDVIGAEFWRVRLAEIIRYMSRTCEYVVGPHSAKWQWLEVWFRRVA